MVQTFLQDTTSVFVGSHYVQILDDRVVYKLAVRGWVLVEDLLYHMVPIEILDEFNDIWLQAFDEK